MKRVYFQRNKNKLILPTKPKLKNLIVPRSHIQDNKRSKDIPLKKDNK